MNVFIFGSSSALAPALIQSYFATGCRLFTSDEYPAADEKISRFLERKTGGLPMNLVFLLQGEGVLHDGLTRARLRQDTRRHVEVTGEICRYFALQPQKPDCIFLESSVLIYQQEGEDMAVEGSRPGGAFPAQYYQRLEMSTKAAEENGIRVIHLRLGKLVCRTAAPSLPRLPLLRHHVPVLFPNTHSKVSWVSQEDAMRAIAYVLADTGITSPVNITSGDILASNEFLKITTSAFRLGPAIPLPAILIRTILGTEAAALLGAGARAIPLKLMESGFLFNDISLQEYLQG